MDNLEKLIKRGVNEILPDGKKFFKLLKSRKITLYQGFDPTSESLHIGHFIGIRKLAQFQKLGHKVIFLIGDFTAKIGDPTDKDAVRKRLSDVQVKKNFSGYLEQIRSLLDFEGENKAQVKYNSEWNSNVSFSQVIDLASNFTVQQMLERNMFKNRLKQEKPVYLHEFLYPLIQGYDSVVMNVDLEVGGNDQLFNMMAGRILAKNINGKEKYVMTLKLLEDNNGNKMGKTTGNALNLTDKPEDMFGKIMSMDDKFLNPAYELLTDIDYQPSDPMNDKKRLAYDVVRQVKGRKAAQKAQEHFESTFQKKKPGYRQEVALMQDFITTIANAGGLSKSEAKRLVKQQAVSVNSKKVHQLDFKLKKGDKIKIGAKTFVRVT